MNLPFGGRPPTKSFRSSFAVGGILREGREYRTGALEFTALVFESGSWETFASPVPCWGLELSFRFSFGTEVSSRDGVFISEAKRLEI